MFIKSLLVRSINFDDIAKFSNDEPDMDLVDIINDVTKEVNENDFLSDPRRFCL